MEPNQETKDRIDAFMKAYGELTQQFKVDFVSYPMFVPDGQGAFKVVLQNQAVDTSQSPIKSPFIPQE